MPDAAFRDFIPTLPDTGLDRAARALFDALPSGLPAVTRFGSADCPPGGAIVEPIGCCWDFGSGAAGTIERLSLGAANAWRIFWICEPGDDAQFEDRHAGPPSGAALPAPATRPWAVRHPDVEMTVFPVGMNATLRGSTGAISIAAGTTVGKISYAPNGKRAFDPGNRTYAVAHVFSGFDLLFGCMEAALARGFPMPEYLLGDALQGRMALFLGHLDFDVIDNGELGASVFAPVDRVRAALARHQERASRLLARANRETARLTPSSTNAKS